MAADTRVQFRAAERTLAWLQERSARMHTATVSTQASTELGLWQDALAAELRRIRLTLAQANCLADVLNGVMLTPASGGFPVVYTEAADAFDLARADHLDADAYGTKWGIDEEALLRYLRSLGPTADHALHDAVSRWRLAGAEPTAKGWESVGLRVSTPDA